MSFVKFFKSLLEHKPSQVVPPTALKTNPSPNQVETETTVPSSSQNTTGSSIIKAIKPHVPLIKFRKGGLPDARSGQAAAQPSSGGSGRKGSIVQATIEDYQLPLKYRRQPLDEKEIEYINRGGPE